MQLLPLFALSSETEGLLSQAKEQGLKRSEINDFEGLSYLAVSQNSSFSVLIIVLSSGFSYGKTIYFFLD